MNIMYKTDRLKNYKYKSNDKKSKINASMLHLKREGWLKKSWDGVKNILDLPLLWVSFETWNSDLTYSVC